MPMLPTVGKVRHSNLEWLRIVSMICIIATHNGHGLYPETMSAFNLLVKTCLTAFSKLGVNCFILISGYFLLNSRFNLRKVVRLIATVWVYSVALYLGFALGEGTFDWGAFARAFFPLIFNQYWFMTAYMIAYLVSPFVAIMLKACSQTQHRAFLLTLFVLASVLGLIPSVALLSEAGWFVFLMALGAYLSRYPYVIQRIKPWMAMAAWAVLYAVIVIVQFFLHYGMSSLTHPIGLVWALALFVTFANAKIPDSKIVNRLAAGSLGVYLIHDNNYVRPRLWNDWLHVGFHAEQGTYVLFAVAAIALIWTVCTLVDVGRGVLFAYAERGLDALVRKIKKVETPQEPADLAKLPCE